MYRTALTYLKEWVKKSSRKPLVVRGARQVGKSYLVQQLAAEEFDNCLEINLETDVSAASLFASKNPDTIIPLLEARYDISVTPGRTLLFLDEIQAAPELLACLRYFYEQTPALHVIAAGSLLDFSLADHAFSMPVGRIEYLHLGPMTFDEFLLASGRDRLLAFLSAYRVGTTIPQSIHREAMSLLTRYVIVGGMPASVSAFVATGDHRESEAVRQSLLSTYRDDFSKYAKRVSPVRIEKVFLKIPQLLGSKLVYSRIDREERSRDLSKALSLLLMARVSYKVQHTAANGIPLGAEAKNNVFKVIFMDVGLLCRSLGLTVLDFDADSSIMLVNAGAVCEQFVGQHLLHDGEPYEEPALYCWMRQQKSSSAEVDYLITVGEHIVPVEVKSGKTGTLKSLHSFLCSKNRDFAIRFNADAPSLLEAQTSLPGGNNRPFRLLSLPLYLIGQTRRLSRECLKKP